MLEPEGKQLVLDCKQKGIPTGGERLTKDREAGQQRLCDLQDVFGRATHDELVEWYEDASQRDRECIVWVLANVHDQGLVHDALTRMVANAEVAELTERIAVLDATSERMAQEIVAGLDALAEKDAKLEQANEGHAELVRRKNRLRDERTDLRHKVLTLKAGCWDLHEELQWTTLVKDKAISDMDDAQQELAQLLPQQDQ